MINWAWAYLFGEHGVRLIAPAEPPPGKQWAAADAEKSPNMRRTDMALHRK